MDGQVRFSPQKGTKAPVVIEAISDGRYATEKSGGVPVGSYRIEILAFDPSTRGPRNAEDPPRPQLLPAKWNSQSELELVVEAGKDKIARDFELTL